MRQNNLISILQEIKNISPFPPISVKLLDLINEDDFNPKEISEIIKIDPIITSKCLNICNSPYLGLRQKITSVEDSIILLGWDNIFKLIQSISFSEVKFNDFRLWFHNISVAILTQIIYKKIKSDININLSEKDVINLYTSGLVHDIGKLVIDSFLKEDCFLVEKLRLKKKLSTIQIEEKLYGITHNDISQKILTNWNFPDVLIDIIKQHRTTNFIDLPLTEIKVNHILELANMIYYIFNYNNRYIYKFIDPKILKQFKIEVMLLKEIRYEYINEFSKIDKLINI